jgi:hypothetical protein
MCCPRREGFQRTSVPAIEFLLEIDRIAPVDDRQEIRPGSHDEQGVPANPMTEKNY